MNDPIIEELKTLRDEIKVQAHLMTMDAKDKFEELEKRYGSFETIMEDYIAKFGQFNEDFWVGHKAEIDQMLTEYKELKKSHNNAH